MAKVFDSEIVHTAALFNERVFKYSSQLLDGFPFVTDVPKLLFKDVKSLSDYEDATIVSMLSSVMIPDEISNFIDLVHEMKEIKDTNQIDELINNLFKYYKTRKVHEIVNNNSTDVDMLVREMKLVPDNLSTCVEINQLGSLDIMKTIEDEIGEIGKPIPTNFPIIAESTPFGGYLPGQVIQWCAAPGRGKSAAMLYEVAIMAVNGYKVLWCFVGDTIVQTLNYGDITLEELYKLQAKNIEVYCTTEEGVPKVSIAESVEITGYADELIELEIDDTFIRCTPDHLFLLTTGEWKRACDLSITDEIMDITINTNDSKYESCVPTFTLGDNNG